MAYWGEGGRWNRLANCSETP